MLGKRLERAKIFLYMIKIEPLFATDSTQVRALLRYQDEPMPYESFCAEEKLLFTGLNFWQHWLPCQWHVAPSVYLAKEEGIVLGPRQVAPRPKLDQNVGHGSIDHGLRTVQLCRAAR